MAGDKENMLCEEIPRDRCLIYSGFRVYVEVPRNPFYWGACSFFTVELLQGIWTKAQQGERGKPRSSWATPGVPTAKADLPAIILGPPGKKPMQLSDSQTPFSLLMQMHPRDITERDH